MTWTDNFEVFAAIEADDVGEETDLGCRRLLLAPVRKPQRDRQGDV
jgi:hypothetical protein